MISKYHDPLRKAQTFSPSRGLRPGLSDLHKDISIADSMTATCGRQPLEIVAKPQLKDVKTDADQRKSFFKRRESRF